MIHHISIAAENPCHVATVLAEIWNGQVAPFPPHPGSYVVVPGDEHGTMIEIYPRGTEMRPGEGNEEAIFFGNPLSSGFTATHAAISVPATAEQIEFIAAREGWRAVRCNRENVFEVIEFWVENTWLVELLPPAFAKRYLEFMQPENLKQFFVAQPMATASM